MKQQKINTILTTVTVKPKKKSVFSKLKALLLRAFSFYNNEQI